jgi:hypothetical protein
MGTSHELVAPKDNPAELIGARISASAIRRVQQPIACRRHSSVYHYGVPSQQLKTDSQSGSREAIVLKYLPMS